MYLSIIKSSYQTNYYNTVINVSPRDVPSSKVLDNTNNERTKITLHNKSPSEINLAKTQNRY